MPSAAEKIEACSLSLQYVHKVLCDVSREKEQWGENDSEEQAADELNVTQQMKCSLRLGAALWSLDGTAWSDDVVGRGGHTAMVVPSGRTMRQKATAPKKKLLRERVYTQLSATSVDSWFRRFKRERLKPNAEQLAYLHGIRD